MPSLSGLLAIPAAREETHCRSTFQASTTAPPAAADIDYDNDGSIALTRLFWLVKHEIVIWSRGRPARRPVAGRRRSLIFMRSENDDHGPAPHRHLLNESAEFRSN